MPADGMLSAAALWERGWSPALVRRFLGEADATKPNPRFRSASPMRLYTLARVEAAEKLPEFLSAKAVTAAKQAAAAKAVATKKQNLLRQIESLEVVVRPLATDLVQRLSMAARNPQNRRPEIPHFILI